MPSCRIKFRITETRTVRLVRTRTLSMGFRVDVPVTGSRFCVKLAPATGHFLTGLVIRT